MDRRDDKNARKRLPTEEKAPGGGRWGPAAGAVTPGRAKRGARRCFAGPPHNFWQRGQTVGRLIDKMKKHNICLLALGPNLRGAHGAAKSTSRRKVLPATVDLTPWPTEPAFHVGDLEAVK